MITICGNSEWNYGHCANMECWNYISKCPLHARAQTGNTCNLVANGRWAWLVEESTFSVGLPVEVITFHVIVVARDYELAFNLANREAEAYTDGKSFLCSASDLTEVDSGYLWHFGESPSGYTVRRLYQVPPWTPALPIRFQWPNALATPRTEVNNDA